MRERDRLRSLFLLEIGCQYVGFRLANYFSEFFLLRHFNSFDTFEMTEQFLLCNAPQTFDMIELGLDAGFAPFGPVKSDGKPMGLIS